MYEDKIALTADGIHIYKKDAYPPHLPKKALAKVPISVCVSLLIGTRFQYTEANETNLLAIQETARCFQVIEGLFREVEW